MNFLTEKISVIGNHRSGNEDAIECSDGSHADFFWMIIADGMGGHNGGEVASNRLTQLVSQEVVKLKPNAKQNWSDWIKSVIEMANQLIFDQAQGDVGLEGMGTTGVLLICQQDHFYIGWVGDSRAYLWRHQTLQQLTSDHSAIQYLLDKGAITELEAERSNTKHILAKAIGVKPTVEVDVVSGKLDTDDVFLLSTDGIHDTLADDTMACYLEKFYKAESITKNMVQQALTEGSKDNLSFGVVKIRAK